MKKTGTLILISFLSALVSLITFKLLATYDGGLLQVAAITFFLLLIILLILKATERFIPKPKELKIGNFETKPILKSKTFWGAFVIFALTTIEELGIQSVGTPEEIKDVILNIDFKNAGQAVLSLFIIFIRYFETQKIIDGITEDQPK